MLRHLRARYLARLVWGSIRLPLQPALRHDVLPQAQDAAHRRFGHQAVALVIEHVERRRRVGTHAPQRLVEDVQAFDYLLWPVQPDMTQDVGYSEGTRAMD